MPRLDSRLRDEPVSASAANPGASQPATDKPVPQPLNHSVAECLDGYFQSLNGHAPVDLYDIVLGEVEPPLLRATLRYCAGNQSRAAGILGLNRATLRKKLAQYRISADDLK